MQTGYASDPGGTIGLMQTFAASLRGLGTTGNDILLQLQAQGDPTSDAFAQQLAALGYAMVQGDGGNNTLNAVSGKSSMLLGLGGGDTLNGGGSALDESRRWWDGDGSAFRKATHEYRCLAAAVFGWPYVEISGETTEG